MIREYDIVFKLPCEKTFTFNIFVSDDCYDPTTEVGNYPSRYLLDYFLLYYIPQLKDYSDSEISNGTVVSVRQKNNSKTVDDDAERASENESETTPSIKSLYWKNGYIVKSRANGFGIISNDLIFCKSGSIHKSDLDEALISESFHSNDIIEVYDNSAICGFNPYNEEEIRRHCHLVWSRFVEMSREEVERMLNLPKGSLIITD